MKTGNDNKRHGLAEVSAAPRKRKTPKNEAEYLQQQASDALAAVRLTFRDMENAVSSDPNAWTGRHPLMTVSAASAGGFLASSLLLRRRPSAHGNDAAAGANSVGTANGGGIRSQLEAAIAEPLVRLARVCVEAALQVLLSSVMGDNRRDGKNEEDSAVSADERQGAD